MMRFAAFEWIIFLPLLLAAGFFLRSLKLWLPLRACCCGLILLLLMQPQIRQLEGGLDLWVLVDRSASAAETLAPRMAEIEALLSHSKSAEDRVFYIDYADLAQVRGEADEIPENKKQQTRTALAIRYALSKMKSNRASRLLLLTDGYSTEPLSGISERLVQQQVPLDYRLLSFPGTADWRIQELKLPPQAQINEPFLIEVSVAGQPDEPVDCTIFRDGTPIGSAKMNGVHGKGSVRFTDRLSVSGAHQYTAQISAQLDSRPGNNRAQRWIEIVGGPRILLATSYPNDPLATALRAQKFEVEIVTDLASLGVGRLAGTKAVILNNVPAHKFSPDFLAALPFYVKEQGGGLLMVGGKSSFGAGGYFNSPIDELLPVSMELRTEFRKLAVAMAVVMDRSGSMSCAVPGGLQKIELADEGTARCVELLEPKDEIAVFAVDTQPHKVVPLMQVGGRQTEMTNAIRRIGSSGGGICVPTGLRAAYEELKQSKAGQRHVVLFADANDATQELGDYPTLVNAMAKEGITISVIGLGSETDSGGSFLNEIATLGKGRIFFNADASQLPAIFAQETVAVARSAFLDEPVKLVPSLGWHEMAAKSLNWLDAVDGYNLSYLKPEATAAAVSGDEYKAPLIAFWQRGAGHSAAISFPLAGDFSQRTRAWPQYGDFIQTTVRWLMGTEVPPGIALRTRLNGLELQVDLLYAADWEPRLAQAPPKIHLGNGVKGTVHEAVWERMVPGHLRCTVTLEPEVMMRGVVQTGPFTLPFGPVMAGSNLEWATDPDRLAELHEVAQASSGGECIDLSKIWKAPRRVEYRTLRPWLLVLLLVVFLAEAIFTRMGWKTKIPEMKAPKSSGAAVPIAAEPIHEKARPSNPSKAEPKKTEPTPPPQTRETRFKRAKRL